MIYKTHKWMPLFATIFALLFSNCIPNSGLSTDIPIVTAQSPAQEVSPDSIPTDEPAVSETAPGAAPVETGAVGTTAMTPTVFIPTVMRPGTSTPPPVSGGLIANNAVIAQFESIPAAALEAARARNIWFYHQSTGGYISDMGLNCLSGARSDPNYNPPECVNAGNPDLYDWSSWEWPFYPEPMADAPAKMDQFVSLVPSIPSKYDVIGMKYCYVDGWNQDFDQYRIKMENLERQYPNKVFIWATSALWGDPGDACRDNGFNSCENIAAFNNQLRAYASANNKPLFDIASIESNGSSCRVDGYEGLCAQYYSDGGGHPTYLGSIRLAKGFWWLMAKLSGWN